MLAQSLNSLPLALRLLKIPSVGTLFLNAAFQGIPCTPRFHTVLLLPKRRRMEP
ncbi:hypothetical protein BJX66DRAFT_320337 [Aspergillus keveii]|uniref:Uncharacterized protein n=1 Tax=Aspergillus keveii TaxID=714993 RepID=A0ABR4FHM1_9EURO